MAVTFFAIALPVSALVLLGLRKWLTLVERVVVILLIFGVSIFILGIAAFNPPLKNQISPLVGLALILVGILIAVSASFKERTKKR